MSVVISNGNTTVSIMTVSIMALSILKLVIATLSKKIKKCDTQYNHTPYYVMILF
jgi:hypothetical protein